VLVLWGIDRQFSSSGEFSSLFVEHTSFGRNMRVFFLGDSSHYIGFLNG
jgi:hypothetical protein